MKKMITCPVFSWAKKLFTVGRCEQLACFWDASPQEEQFLGKPVYDYSYLEREDGFVCKKMVWDYTQRDEYYYLFQNINDLCREREG